jgi:hypothetical protein
MCYTSSALSQQPLQAGQVIPTKDPKTNFRNFDLFLEKSLSGE